MTLTAIIEKTLPAYAPTRWTEGGLRVLKERYLIKNEKGVAIETPEEMCWRVGRAVAQAEEKFGTAGTKSYWTEQFVYHMLNGDFLPNSPTLMNAGTNNGLCWSACFVIPLDDSIEAIYETLKTQAIIQKSGGGTGMALSKLRQNGAFVRGTSGVSSGPIAFLKVLNSSTEQIKQGGKRRGANMAVMRVSHPDLYDFIDCKVRKGMLHKEDGTIEEMRDITNFNISVAITDEFMDALERDDVYNIIEPHTGNIIGQKKAKETWERICTRAWETADPGIFFIDTANNTETNPAPDSYTIEATNPCITGDSLVYTSEGLIPMRELAERNLPFFATLANAMSNGAVQFGPATAPWSSGIKPVFRVKTKEGYEIRCTADHKIMTVNRGMVPAQELNQNDKIQLLDHKGGFGQEGTLGEGRVLGWIIGDGNISDAGNGVNRAILDFWGEERSLAPMFASYVDEIIPVHALAYLNRGNIAVQNIETTKKSHIASTRLARILEEKYGINGQNKVDGLPVVSFSQSEDFQRGLLQSLFTADGSVQGSLRNGFSVRLASSSLPLLKDTQKMLLNFGIRCIIYENRREAQFKDFGPTRGGVYWTQAQHEISITSGSLIAFNEEIGFLNESKNAKLSAAVSRYTKNLPIQKFFAGFLMLVPDGEEEVFDLTEQYTHSFITNGTAVSNCGEVPMMEYDVCNLASINLSKFVKGSSFDWVRFREVVRIVTRFLDDVVEENPYPLPQIKQMAMSFRRIGLGPMGFADALILLGIPYESAQAMEFAEELMKVMHEEALIESEKLAQERGSFPMQSQSRYKDNKPRRNSNLTTAAPTGTISILDNCSSGIEPLFALGYMHKAKLPDGSYRYLNIAFESIEYVAKREGFWSEEFANHIQEYGTLKGYQGIISDKWHSVLQTAMEISPLNHVLMQSAWQKYNDSGISKTTNLPNNATVEEISELYKIAHRTGCIGITVFRDGCLEHQVLNVGKKTETTKTETTIIIEEVVHSVTQTTMGMTECPECHEMTFIHESGCDKCVNPDCQYSHCTI